MSSGVDTSTVAGRAFSSEPTEEESRIPALHVFEYQGRHVGFIVQTGDLVSLDLPSARCLSLHEAGAPIDALEELLVAEDFDKGVAKQAVEDLQLLISMGNLGSEKMIGHAQKEADIQRLFRHQPRNLMFFVTEACNLSCAYCYEKSQGVHDAPEVMRQREARAVIDDYFDNSPRREALTITFFGGEPLLNPKLIREVVSYARERATESGQAVGFTMTTNLTLLEPEMARFLAEEGFHVMVSLDGNREANDRYRVDAKGEGTYDRVVENLQVLIGECKRAGTRLPKIRATLTAENRDSEQVEKHLRSLGTHLVMVGETHGTVLERKDHDVRMDQDGPSSELSSSEIAMDRIIDALESNPNELPEFPPMIRQALFRVHEHMLQGGGQEIRPSICGVCRNMKAVTPSGDVYPCHRYVGMNKFRMGNVFLGGINDESVARYYDDIFRAFSEECVSCWLRNVCGGQCPWYLSTDDGKVHAPDQEMCNSIREGHERIMGFYALLLSEHPEHLRTILGVEIDSE